MNFSMRAVIVAVVACLALVVAPNAGATTFTPAAAQTVVDNALATNNKAALQALVNLRDPVIDTEMLKHVTVKVTTTETAAPTNTSYGGGCHYTSFSSTHNIDEGPLHIGQQKVTEYGYCWTASWSGGLIRWWGGYGVHRWAQVGFCWSGTDSGDFFNPYPHWRTAHAEGSLGANYVFGCQALQYDVPYIDYAAGGGIFRH